MVISDFSPADSTLWTDLIHNRLNFKWYPNDNFTAYFDIRTRLYYGDYVKLIPNFGEQLSSTEDFFDWSWLIIGDEDAVFQENNVLLHTVIDRAYMEWQKSDWNIRVGRQRINWGVNLVWNPNDLFNAFSYVDFDYEERPGSDAIRIQKYTGFASSFDFAANIADDLDNFVASSRWATNKWNYDFQTIAGFARNDLALGGAWAGNIKAAGFKGEFTYFIPVNNNPENHAFVGTLSYDIIFKSELYFNSAYLFNSDGETDLGLEGFLGLYDRSLTARNLSPYKHSIFLQLMYPVHPLMNIGLATMFFPGSKGLFINPVITFSLLQNLDFDVIGQLYYDVDPRDENWKAISKVFYYRLKWSF